MGGTVVNPDLDLVTTLLVLTVGLVSAALLVLDLVRRERVKPGDAVLARYARPVGLGLVFVFLYLVAVRFALFAT